VRTGLLVAARLGIVMGAFALAPVVSAQTEGAAECQPAAGEGTAALAQTVGGLGALAKEVATLAPHLIAEKNNNDLFNCP
jgi:hypothetical protein